MTLVSLPIFTQSSGIHRDANRESGATNIALEMGEGVKNKDFHWECGKSLLVPREEGGRRREREQMSGLRRKEHVALYFN